jgi:adiponectin receptor
MPNTGSTTTAPHRGPDPAPPELRHRQRQPPSPEPESTTPIQTLETALQHLLHWDALPPWRRDNPSILSGYRPTSNSLLASLRSLGYLHNESVNIWTHLLGAGAAAASAVGCLCLGRVVFSEGGRYATASAADVVVWGCFFGGAVACLGMSATYHALCNHSEEVARWGNKLDYTGIVLLIVGSFVPALWYGFFCRAALLTGYLGAVSYSSSSPCVLSGLVVVGC